HALIVVPGIANSNENQNGNGNVVEARVKRNDLDKVAFRRNTCFIKNLKGVDLLKGDHTTNPYTINLHEMASASPIYLMARATSTLSCTMELSNVKEAMKDPPWIDSIQEELLQFKRLDVWVLVPTLDKIKPLTLKWLFKNKHDEESTVIRNKTLLVVRGYRQEKGIDFEKSFTLLLE
nr:Gag-Pol polyprotein [Tanacetum cinerariifolium]